MYRATHLDASTARDTPLPNTFFRNHAGSDTLAVVFPGLGYRATMPLLHYSQRALQWRGADILRLDLAYDLDPAFPSNDPSRRQRWIRDDAHRAYQAATEQGDYRNVVLIGKSLGTLALTAILERDEQRRAPACVWLTPLLNDASLVEAIRRRRPASLHVIGTADPLFDRSLVDDLAAHTGRTSVIVEGADHSLEIPGDMAKTLQGMQAYLSALDGFLANLERNA